jgi:hypothetical protein
MRACTFGCVSSYSTFNQTNGNELKNEVWLLLFGNNKKILTEKWSLNCSNLFELS